MASTTGERISASTPARKRRYWLSVPAEIKTEKELEAIEVIFYSVLGVEYKDAGLINRYLKDGSFLNRVQKTSPEGIVTELRSNYLKKPDQHQESFQNVLNIFLSLPKIMHNYAARTQQSMRTILEEVVAATNGEE